MGRLSDALKALFGSNKTTGTYVPLVTSNGTPDGNMSMDNFATAMGGKIYNIGSKTLPNNTDLDTIGLDFSGRGLSVYDIQCDSTTVHAPMLGRINLLVFGQSATNYIIQVALNTSNGVVTVKMRSASSLSGVFGEWKTISLT